MYIPSFCKSLTIRMADGACDTMDNVRVTSTKLATTTGHDTGEYGFHCVMVDEKGLPRPNMERFYPVRGMTRVMWEA